MVKKEIDYILKFKELQIPDNPIYPRNDIGVARLFFDLHSEVTRYVVEANVWYFFDGRRWVKDERGLQTMELCKSFAQNFAKFAGVRNDGSKESNAFEVAAPPFRYPQRWAKRQHGCGARASS